MRNEYKQQKYARADRRNKNREHARGGSPRRGVVCGKTGKRTFSTETGALNRGQELSPDQYWRAYTCPFCGDWHLTSKQLHA